MNPLEIYILQLAITGGICLAVVIRLLPPLHTVLVDLCGSNSRAHFWEVFSSIILIGLPLLFGMGYNPLKSVPEMQFFDGARQIRNNLFGFVMVLIGIGGAVSFFALVARHPDSK